MKIIFLMGTEFQFCKMKSPKDWLEQCDRTLLVHVKMVKIVNFLICSLPQFKI